MTLSSWAAEARACQRRRARPNSALKPCCSNSIPPQGAPLCSPKVSSRLIPIYRKRTGKTLQISDTISTRWRWTTITGMRMETCFANTATIRAKTLHGWKSRASFSPAHRRCAATNTTPGIFTNTPKGSLPATTTLCSGPLRSKPRALRS